jgi:biotin transport system substrate-specific component
MARQTLADRMWAEAGPWRDAVLVAGGALVVALASQIVVPLTPVPVTGQTLAVLLVGAALGARRGALSLLAYVAAGAAGLPVFAGGAAGMARLTGPTAGYLVGFIAGGAAVGWLCQRGWDRSPGSTFLAMLLGQLLIYIPGVAWLAGLTGLRPALAAGLAPFIFGDVLKAALAALLLPYTWHVLRDSACEPLAGRGRHG